MQVAHYLLHNLHGNARTWAPSGLGCRKKVERLDARTPQLEKLGLRELLLVHEGGRKIEGTLVLALTIRDVRDGWMQPLHGVWVQTLASRSAEASRIAA